MQLSNVLSRHNLPSKFRILGEAKEITILFMEGQMVILIMFILKLENSFASSIILSPP